MWMIVGVCVLSKDKDRNLLWLLHTIHFIQLIVAEYFHEMGLEWESCSIYHKPRP